MIVANNRGVNSHRNYLDGDKKMNGMDKVIKGLQCCKNIDVICMDIHCYEPEFSECPYHTQENCVAELCKDALEELERYKAFRRHMFNRCAALTHCDTCEICVYYEECGAEKTVNPL